MWWGKSIGTEEVITVGFWATLPAIITIVFRAVKKGIEIAERRKIAASEQAAAEAKRLEAERKKEEALQEQRAARIRYITSPETKRMLKALCGGDASVFTPQEITIYDDRVQSQLNGKTYTFDFAANRIFNFECVIEVVHSVTDLQYVLKPQLLMAEALNYLMGEQYTIFDEAKMNRSEHTHSDGESYYLITYTSDHVVMKLTSTLPNKTF